ncbi:hypothetical protein [Niabella hibiscisoli]|uniref:hypothetical protein n=1 Tax=Niabella hibiscisoli TaxID=1825928 RepID=UPI001F0D5C8C|nr:hypothetical protein [Niabella hibiscisoli]MCH5716399.1 hypothetical protein [Niabella hibiscisoli]
MKLSLLFLGLALQVSATNYGQTISLSEEQVSLNEIFKKIEKNLLTAFIFPAMYCLKNILPLFTQTRPAWKM